MPWPIERLFFTEVVKELSKDAEGEGFHKLPDIPDEAGLGNI